MLRATPFGLFLTGPAVLAVVALPGLSLGDEGEAQEATPSTATPAGLDVEGEGEAVAGMAMLQQAFWMDAHEGAHVEALALYERVARERAFAKEVRREAERRASVLMQDLVATDLTQVLPHDALLYMELSEPGDNLAAILTQLGLYGHGSEMGRPAISPDLVQALVGAKGMAMAVTGMPVDGRPPSGVLVFHPGDLDATRGFLETTLSAQGRPAERIEDYATWTFPVAGGFGIHVTMTERMFIVSNDVYEIGAVIERMRGDDPDSLAANVELATALESRHGALLSLCFNAKPLMPMVHAITSQVARQAPEAALAMSLVDVESFRALSAHVTAGEDGLGMEVALELDEGHRNLLFDLFRRPNVQPETFAMVPEGAAFAFATALNPEAGVAPLASDSTGRPVVTLMDIGRELFSNVVDVAFFGVPSDGYGAGAPDVALLLRANDTSRTTAMLDLVMGLMTQAGSGGQAVAASETIAGVDARRYEWNGLPLFVAADSGRVVVSPSHAAIARAIDAASGHGSLLTDAQFATDVAEIDGSSALMGLVAPGRLAQMAKAYAPASQQRHMAPMGQILDGAVLSARFVHDERRLGLETRLRSLPDVSGLVAGMFGDDGAWSAPLDLPDVADVTALATQLAAMR